MLEDSEKDRQRGFVRGEKGQSVMSAVIIELATYRERRADTSGSAARAGEAEFTERFHFWTGASGKRYIHTVYRLTDCPPLSTGNYILVKRADNGERTLLAVGRAEHAASSLNLAEIRQKGASLGANEVHIHLLAENAKQMKLVEFDLRAGQLDPTGGDNSPANRN